MGKNKERRGQAKKKAAKNRNAKFASWLKLRNELMKAQDRYLDILRLKGL